MILKRLEMQGFKSFADKINMDFGMGVTGIVGPNGSGKSNVSDAVRWVLGEQSAKQLRGGTMQDIIFNGSEKRKQQQFCEVSLTFDNTDQSINSEYEEIMVTRRVYRSGESQYYLNKTACRLKDIVDLFRDTGIGKDGYSLIGQGRIDEILSIKSEDMREIFEEAAGIVKFKARRTEAERRLANTAQNLVRIEDIVHELETSMGPLREQSEKAREYTRMSETLKTLELSAFVCQYDAAQKKIADLTEKMNRFNAQQAECETQEHEYETQIEALERQIEQDERTLEEKRNRVIDATRAEEAAQGAVLLGRQQVENLAGQQARLETERKNAQDERAMLESADRFALIEQKKDALRAMRESLKTSRAALTALHEQLTQEEETLDELKRRMIEQINRMSDVQAAYSRMTAMQESMKSRVEQAHQNLDELTGQNERFSVEISQAKDNSEQAKQQLAVLNKALADRQQRHQTLRDDLTAAFAQQEKIAGSQRELASRLKLLEQMQRDYEGYSQSVKEVLKHSKNAGCTGIYGVVASLVNVPKQYERAIEMALGAQAQYIVCQSERDAETMIEFLRRNRYGRATFLPVSTVMGRGLNSAERGALQMEGCLGVASELIGFDSAYRGVMENLLGRTLIADTLHHAIEIMKAYRHTFRMVTLDGDVMNPGGSMTGGSVHTRAVSILSREREIAEHRTAMEKITRRAEEAAAAIVQIKQEREALREEISTVSEQVVQQEIVCARDAERLNAAQERVSQHEAQIQRCQTEIRQLEEALADIEEKLRQTGASRHEEKDAGDDIRQRAEALELQVAALREETETVREAYAQQEREVAAAENELTLLTRDDEHARNEKQRLALLEEKLTSQIAQTLTQQSEAAAAAEQSETELSSAKEALARAQAEERAQALVKLKKQQEQRTLNDELAKLRLQTRDLSERAHKADVALTKVQGDLKAQTDRIWDDYQLTYAGAQPFLTPEFVLNDALTQIDALRKSIRALGNVNVAAIEEYRSVSERYESMSAQREDLLKAVEDLNSIIAELDTKMRKQFVEQFKLLNENFKQTFTHLFGGGNAQLTLCDESDPLRCGIEIAAQPPGKKFQLLSLLSGGERALTAIAILFAILRLKPTPFCILDEIDAALDEANVDNFANFLKDFSKDTQFIVVTHRKGTMEHCNGLYGIAMEEKGVSKIVSVKLEEA